MKKIVSILLVSVLSLVLCLSASAITQDPNHDYSSISGTGFDIEPAEAETVADYYTNGFGSDYYIMYRSEADDVYVFYRKSDDTAAFYITMDGALNFYVYPFENFDSFGQDCRVIPFDDIDWSEPSTSTDLATIIDNTTTATTGMFDLAGSAFGFLVGSFICFVFLGVGFVILGFKLVRKAVKTSKRV